MVIDKTQNGLYFRFERIDWKCNWQIFLAKIKMFDNWQYLPPEKDENEKWWWIPEKYITEFFKIKKQCFDDILHKNQIELFNL